MVRTSLPIALQRLQYHSNQRHEVLRAGANGVATMPGVLQHRGRWVRTPNALDLLA